MRARLEERFPQRLVVESTLHIEYFHRSLYSFCAIHERTRGTDAVVTFLARTLYGRILRKHKSCRTHAVLEPLLKKIVWDIHTAILQLARSGHRFSKELRHDGRFAVKAPIAPRDGRMCVLVCKPYHHDREKPRIIWLMAMRAWRRSCRRKRGPLRTKTKRQREEGIYRAWEWCNYHDR